MVSDLAQQLRAIHELAAEAAVLMEHVVDRAQVLRLDRLAQEVVEEPDRQPKRLLVAVGLGAARDDPQRIGERGHGIVRVMQRAQKTVFELHHALHLVPGLRLGQHLERLVRQAHEVRAIDDEPLLRHP